MGDEKGWTANPQQRRSPFLAHPYAGPKFEVYCPPCRRPPVEYRLSHGTSAKCHCGRRKGELSASCGLVQTCATGTGTALGAIPLSPAGPPLFRGLFRVGEVQKFPKDDPGLSPTVRTRLDWCSSKRGLGLSACTDAMAGGGVVWVASRAVMEKCGMKVESLQCEGGEAVRTSLA